MVSILDAGFHLRRINLDTCKREKYRNTVVASTVTIRTLKNAVQIYLIIISVTVIKPVTMVFAVTKNVVHIQIVLIAAILIKLAVKATVATLTNVKPV